MGRPRGKPCVQRERVRGLSGPEAVAPALPGKDVPEGFSIQWKRLPEPGVNSRPRVSSSFRDRATGPGPFLFPIRTAMAGGEDRGKELLDEQRKTNELIRDSRESLAKIANKESGKGSVILREMA